MANSKHKSDSKKTNSLPEHFNSYQEAGLFWDTHDSAEFEKFMKDTECEVDIKRRIFLIPVDGDLYKRIQSIARKRGISPEALLNMWIQEKAS
jgi:hypothetical protein